MRLLFTTFEGGGHVPPALLTARRLMERGHEVLFVSDEANRPAAENADLAFEAWRTAPNRRELATAADPLQDWRSRFPPAVVRAVCEAVIAGPAGAYARDTLEILAEFPADAIVSNELLFGVIMAAEASNTPCALLTSNVWCFPTRKDVPPFGPGFAPARTGFERRRDEMSRRWIGGWYDAGLPAINRARAGLGLLPLQRTLDQLEAVDRVVLGASRAFDYDVPEPAPPFVYAGPLGDTPAWAKGAAAAKLIDPARPNVLVSFSTTHQDQGRVVARCIRALDGLDLHGVVTLGPALDRQGLPSAKNVSVVERADHDQLAPSCALMLCHGGHGTVMRPLMHGVPVVCIPTGRDQPENAQRIAVAGAGLRLPRDAGVGRIRAAVRRVLGDRRFADAAARLGAAIAREADGGKTAAEAIEGLASGALSPASPRLRSA